MLSMADWMRKLGWIVWCLMVIGWFLSPIINLLVNKIFGYLEFDASTKLKELEIHTIPKLKQMLGAVEEQTVLRAAENKGAEGDLKTLDSMKMHLKSALYEAEDILDLLDYSRIEKDLHHVEDDNIWVENQLAAACAWIAHCKGSWFGRWIGSTFAAVMKSAQSMTRQGQFLIQGWRRSRQNSDLFSVNRAININGAAVLQCAQSWYLRLGQLLRGLVLQCAQSWYQQLGQLFRSVILRISGVPLLPVSINPTRQSPCLESRGSESVPADPARRTAEVMADEEEIVQETQVEEGEGDEIQVGEEEAMSEKIQEESCEGGEVGETLEEETEEESCEEEVKETSKEGKQKEPTSLSILWYCVQSMLTWFAKACFYRDWSYGIVGIKSDKKDASSVESLVPITERISLKNRIKRIEDILDTFKKSDLLMNHNNGIIGITKVSDKESSSFSAKESSSEQKEIDNMHRIIDQKVFGRDKDRVNISTKLREGAGTNAASSSTSKPYSVIGIYGITGSGKSTLAQYVCDYERDAGHFNLIMFILVGNKFSLHLIFRDMLEQITQSRPSKDKDLKSLRKELEENLKDKCFLLVLDDLWVNGANKKERGILLDVLRVGQSGSRILVTAQKKDAAAALGAQEQLPIPYLAEEQYLSMFMHYALEGSQVTSGDDERYKEIGRKITKKLRRSPIAAITVAARLKSNSSIDFWERTSNLDVLDETMGALWWSYQQLVDIRRCFTYCCIFPKTYIFGRDKMVGMWIAQGFVNTSSNGTEELEDIGQSYFDELLTFSFLQVPRRTFLSEEPVGFTIHDLLHKFAEKVSGSEFYRIVSSGSPKIIPRGVHHLFIETNNGVEIEKILELGNLRTLIIKHPWGTMARNYDLVEVLDCLFIRLRKLRVLIIELKHTRNELSVPRSIYHMRHLRYLCFAIFVTHLILPSTFSKLYHIQSTDIRDASYPENLANLICLRHISGWVSCPNIGRLTSLQTLTSFRVEEGQGHELKQLMQLNKLRGNLNIQGLEFVGSKEEALEAQLTHKEGLRRLELHFGYDKDKRFGPDVETEVLEGLCPPKDLKELRIELYKGSRYPSWMLSRHHPDAPKQLHKLQLTCCSQLASIPEDSEFLIGLRELNIYGCDWDRLPENMDRLLSLETLEILFCVDMELLPMLPVQSLKKIRIIGCGVLSRTCEEEGHENWRKIQQILDKKVI